MIVNESPLLQELMDKEREKLQANKPRMKGMLTSGGKKMTMGESRAETDRMVRDAYARQLLDSGYSPHQDWLRAKQGNIFGGMGGAGAAPGYVPPMPGSQNRRFTGFNQSPQAQVLRTVADRHIGDPRDPRTWR